jgi:hypothetical protein
MHNMAMPTGPDHESAGKYTPEATPAPEAAAPAMKVESVSIRKAANGGFLVTCNKTSEKRGNVPGDYKSEDYVFTSLDEAMGYVASEFGQEGAVPAGPAMPGASPAMPMGGGGTMPPADDELV